MEAINIRNLITWVQDFGIWCADGTDIEIRFTPLPLDLPIEGKSDLNWLHGNLYCVVGNAAKFSLPGGDGVTVTVEYEEQENPETSGQSMMKITTQDCGENLSAEALETFFDRPLQSTRTQIGGMGQGMYCLKQRVLALGGSCNVSHRHDGKNGTIVWFLIPFQAVNDVTLPEDDSLMSLDNDDSEQVISASSVEKESSRNLDSILHHNIDVGGGHYSSPLMNVEPLESSRIADHPKLISSSRNSQKNSIQKEGSIRNFRKISDSHLHLNSVILNKSSVLQDLKILVVDDSVPILKVMVKVLKQANAIVVEARNGQDALTKFIDAGGEFDVVITDIQVMCSSIGSYPTVNN